MVAGTAVSGRPGQKLGDTLSGFVTDLTDGEILSHLADPLADPQALLQGAGTRLIVDIHAYARSRDDAQPQPLVTCSLSRETHAADLPSGGTTRIQQSFGFTDGFGRQIQHKMPAEPGPLVPGGPDVAPRWVGSGWTVYDNKGRPVRQFESFFSATHRYESDIRVGVSATLCYDPVGRAVATLQPNHTWQKVVFGPWRQETWDHNDTVLDPRPGARPRCRWTPRAPRPHRVPADLARGAHRRCAQPARAGRGRRRGGARGHAGGGPRRHPRPNLPHGGPQPAPPRCRAAGGGVPAHADCPRHRRQCAGGHRRVRTDGGELRTRHGRPPGVHREYGRRRAVDLRRCGRKTCAWLGQPGTHPQDRVRLPATPAAPLCQRYRRHLVGPPRARARCLDRVDRVRRGAARRTSPEPARARADDLRRKPACSPTRGTTSRAICWAALGA